MAKGFTKERGNGKRALWEESGGDGEGGMGARSNVEPNERETQEGDGKGSVRTRMRGRRV